MIKDNNKYVIIYDLHNRILNLKLYFVFRLYYKSFIKHEIGNIHNFSFKNQTFNSGFADLLTIILQ